jgi:hypothetical protein
MWVRCGAQEVTLEKAADFPKSHAQPTDAESGIEVRAGEVATLTNISPPSTITTSCIELV